MSQRERYPYVALAAVLQQVHRAISTSLTSTSFSSRHNSQNQGAATSLPRAIGPDIPSRFLKQQFSQGTVRNPSVSQRESRESSSSHCTFPGNELALASTLESVELQAPKVLYLV